MRLIQMGNSSAVTIQSHTFTEGDQTANEKKLRTVSDKVRFELSSCCCNSKTYFFRCSFLSGHTTHPYIDCARRQHQQTRIHQLTVRKYSSDYTEYFICSIASSLRRVSTTFRFLFSCVFIQGSCIQLNSFEAFVFVRRAGRTVGRSVQSCVRRKRVHFVCNTMRSHIAQ